MARITLSKNTGFTLIPEGFHVFKVVDVDMSKYDGFGKIEVKLPVEMRRRPIIRSLKFFDDLFIY